ncbi:MAG: ATP-binding cassette domain-containing protein [Cellulosilyticaceae bacterium]
MTEYILNTKNLCKQCNKQMILDHVNMRIKKGDIYGFIGANGAGKTSLIRLITGLTFPTEGEISLFGTKGSLEMTEQRKRIGCIIETPALYEDMTAYQNLEVQRVQKGIPGKKCVQEVLQLVNLDTSSKKKVKHFSLGMKQRLALAIALLGNPEFLILDEPLNGLDPMGIIELRNLLIKLNKEKHITLLVSSHILTELHQLATCYGIIHNGKLIEQLSLNELNEKCKKHIYLKVDDAAKATAILETKLKSHDFKVYPDQVIKLYDYLEEIGEVSKTLSSNGIIIEEISTKGDDLETYFTKLVGGHTYA